MKPRFYGFSKIGVVRHKQHVFKATRRSEGSNDGGRRHFLTCTQCGLSTIARRFPSGWDWCKMQSCGEMLAELVMKS